MNATGHGGRPLKSGVLRNTRDRRYGNGAEKERKKT